MYFGFVVLFLVFCILKLIGFVSAIHCEDPVTLCLSSLWMAQCNITLYIVVFNLNKKKLIVLVIETENVSKVGILNLQHVSYNLRQIWIKLDER